MSKTLAYSSVGIVNVDDGNGIASVDITYAIGASPTTPPGNPLTDGGVIITDINGLPLTDANWLDDIPEVPQGSYLWTRTISTFTNGEFSIAYVVGYSGSDGENGETGVGIQSEREQWYLSNSPSTLTGGSWLYDEPSEIPDGQYLWGRWEFVMSDQTIHYSDAVCRTTIGGLIDITDTLNRQISQKIWSTDISTAISSYDSTTAQTIRDTVSEHTQTLSGFNTRITANETAISNKADGSTVTTLSNQVNSISDTVSGHTQEISATTTRLNNLKLGTKNYIQNSEFFDKTKSPYTSSLAVGPQSSPAAKDGQAAYNTGTTGKIIVTFPDTIVSGQEYVFSFDWNRPYGSQTLRTVIGNTNYDETTVNDQAWHRKEIKFTANANTTQAEIYINASGSSYTLFVRHFQLELGNIASDWHESLDEIGAEISQIGTKAEQTADHLSWIIEEENKTSSTFTFKNRVMELVNADLVIKAPGNSSATVISGGRLATDAIKSTNYLSGSSTDVPDIGDATISDARYSSQGTFLDLSTGNIYSPGFNLQGGDAYFNGTVTANAGQIGDPGNAYWEIGTVTGVNWDDHAGLIAHGDALIQAGKLTMTSDRINSQNAGNYVQINGEWYDFGMQVPNPSAAGDIDGHTHKENFLYIRKIATQPTTATLDSDWTYLYRVDNLGNIYWNGHDISEGTFLPLSGGIITGNLTVTGTLSATASAAQKLSHSTSFQTNLASQSTVSWDADTNVSSVSLGVTGTLGVGNGGTGKSSWATNGIVYASSSSTLSQMSVGTSGQLLTSTGATPSWTNQSELIVGQATMATQDANGDIITTTYRKLNNNTFDNIDVTDLSASNLIVTGAATFTNGLSGDLTGNASTATKVNNDLIIKIESGTTEGTNMFTFNGETEKTVNITKASLGLGAAVSGVSNATSGNVVLWGNGYNVSDSGIGKGDLVSNVVVNNDKLLVYKADNPTQATEYTIDITGQVVTGATVLTDGNGNAISLGSATSPVYFANGVPAQANTIPSVTLNGTVNSTPNFYAPTSQAQSADQVLVSTSGAPTWENQSDLIVGEATKATKDGNGNVITTTYAKADGTNATGTWGINISGNASSATTATTATNDGAGNVITSTYVNLTGAQTISGAKTFSAATNFTNATASTNKSNGAVTVSGGIGVTGRISSNETMIGDHVVLNYNATTSSLDFTFV